MGLQAGVALMLSFLAGFVCGVIACLVFTWWAMGWLLEPFSNSGGRH